jgi:hypothetical protein
MLEDEIELIVGTGGGGCEAALPPPQPVIIQQTARPGRVKTNNVFAFMTCS